MATIDDPRLSIATDPLLNQATVTAKCEVHFTEFEVRSMQLLGLRYTLECRVLNKDLQWQDTVLQYDTVELPGDTSSIQTIEPVTFETVAVMSNLHEHVVTDDQFIAEFTLTDQETHATQVERAPILTVALE